MSAEEKPKKHFRGSWFRAELYDLLEEGDISPRESILLMVIDSLVNVKGNDCYASNKYLGQILHVSERMVRNMIEHLRELKLVRRTGFNGKRRTLVTAWSRVPQPIKRGRKSTSAQTGNVLPGRAEIGFRGINSSSIDTSKENRKSLSPQPSADGESRTATSNGNTPLHPRWRRFASMLANAITTVRKVNLSSKLNSWAQAMRKIHDLDGIPIPRLQEVLKWYCTRVRKADLIRDNSSYLPIAYSGSAFRGKFLRIEDALKRRRADRAKREGRKITVIRDAAG